MASLLASQLANIGTVDRDRLQASTSKFRPSFLFPPRQAASLGNEDIHSLAYNGYLALLAQDSRFERFENPIFGEKAKVTDRTILTKEENAKLDETLNSLLRLLASRFLLKSTGKVLEWLIRRFRINDFNVEELLRAIFPYHETPQFAQMLQIIKLDDPKFQALQAVKTSLQPMPRHHLLTAMSKSHDLFRFVATAVDLYRIQNCLYSTLTAFWAGSVLAYFERVKQIQPQDMAVLLPTIVSGIKSDDRDLRLGSYIVLSHLAARAELSQETAMLLAETVLVKMKEIFDAEEVEAALTTLAIVCEHQSTSLPTFSRKAGAVSSSVLANLVQLGRKNDILALLKPLLPAILEVANEDKQLEQHLQGILAAPTCPEQVTQVAVRHILAFKAGRTEISALRMEMLESIEQRLPEGVSLLSYAANAQDPTVIRLVPRLGSTKATGQKENVQHRDAAVRAARLQELLQSANGASSPESEAAVLDALSDSSAQVAQVVFDDKHSAILRQVSASHPVKAFEQCLVDANLDLPSEVTILRAKFLLQILSASAPGDIKYRILTEYLWSRLLASKGNLDQINQLSVAIDNVDKNTWPIFKDFQIIKLTTEQDATKYNDKLAEILSNASQHLNVADQARFAGFLQDTAGVAVSAGAHSKSTTLSILVILRSLAKGNEKFAPAVLKHIPSGSDLSTASTLHGQPGLSSSLAHRVWSKPASTKTQVALRASAFCTAMHVLAASSVKEHWQWLTCEGDLEDSVVEHRALVSRVYELAHMASVNLDTKTKVLQSLYTHQASIDSLALLAAVYTSTKPDNLRVIALLDATHVIKAQPAWDYQVIVPSLIYVLATSKAAVCQAALRVISCINSAQAEVQKGQIYGFDAFYGKKQSGKLQYLEHQHLAHLLRAILREEATLLVDGTYVQQVFVDALEASDAESKKLTRSVLASYIISHAESWRNIPARSALFSAVQRTVDEKRSSLFQTFIMEALDPISSKSIGGNAVENKQYWALVLKCLKARSVSDEALRLFTRVLEDSRTDDFVTNLRAEVRSAFEDWILKAATSHQRCEIFETVSTVARTSDVNLTLLRCCLRYADVLQSAINNVKDSVGQTVSDNQTSKKARASREKPVSAELARTALILENTDVGSVTASIELLASFLSLLASLVDMSTSHIDVDYYLQITCTRASEVASSIQEPLEDTDLRVGPVLETIRISSNPATSNAALNLMADLARLAPAQVAQNVMPIFTFMGTNVLQRDDAQSTRIVDKTIRTIVPALISQRRQRSATREEVVQGMEEVLRVFVDAATHVPRHRRLHLFIRFVDILGPEDFLGPVCTLMVDKVAAKYIKSRDASLISLPLGLYQNFNGVLQLSAIQDQLHDLHEKIELLNNESSEESVSSRHSSPATPAESPMLPVKSSRRTVLALLFFLQEVLASKKLSIELQRERSAPQVSIEPKLAAITQVCLQFVSIKAQRLPTTDVSHLSAGGKVLIKALTRLMNTSEFASTMDILLASDATEVPDMGIDLLVERLATVKPAHRLQLGPTLSSALVYLTNVLLKTDNKSQRLHALLRIRAVAAYCADEEVAQLYSALISVLDMAEKSTSTTFSHQAILFIIEAIPRLGGRIIPAVHRLIMLLSSLIRQHVEKLSVSANRNLAVTAFAGLESLLQCAPTFVAKDLRTVLNLCVSAELGGGDSPDSAALVKSAASKVVSACTKKLPPQALYQAIQELYSQHLASQSPATEGVVSILAQTIKHTSTRAVADMHKSLFGQLLRILNVRSMLSQHEKLADNVEKAAVGAFMQLALKLNEATFRPLFMRLVDWTNPDSAEVSQSGRQLTFFKIMDRMLVQLKGIAIPYYGLAADLTVQILKGSPDEKLWQSTLSSLRRALDADAGSFWTEARLTKFAEPLAEQGRKPFVDRSALLETYKATIQAFANAAATHFSALQSLHQALLRLARDDKQSVQLAAVRALQAMWDSEAQPELIAFKPESMPTIAELLETGGQVEQETKQLLSTMAEGEEDAEMAEDDDDDSDDDGDLDEDE